MSFSYGSVPEPESPPLKALALSPAPARTDRRTKRYTTLSPPDISSLSLLDDPLDLNDGRRISESSLQRSASARPSSRITAAATAMSLHASLSTLSTSTAGTLISPAPRMINPLPAHYRHPSPSPSYESSTPSLTSSTTTAADSNCSSVSSASSVSASSVNVKKRKSIIAKKPSIQSFCQHVNCNGRCNAQAPHTSDDSLSSLCEPLTPTSTTFSRSRGKSISRAVGKLASDILSLKKKDRSDPDSVPAVPALPTSSNYRK